MPTNQFLLQFVRNNISKLADNYNFVVGEFFYHSNIICIIYPYTPVFSNCSSVSDTLYKPRISFL